MASTRLKIKRQENLGKSTTELNTEQTLKVTLKYIFPVRFTAS